MRTLHATTAAQRGLQGSDRFTAAPFETPETGRFPLPGKRGAFIWAVVTSALAASAVAFGDPVSTSYIYGIDDDSKLWVMALTGTSGTSTFLGTSVLTGSSANGLAYDAGREQLYGVDTATNQLYWWQQGAATYTSLGNISAYTAGIGSPVSAAYFNNAYWFLGDGNPGNVLGKLEFTYTGGIPTAVSGTSFTIIGMSGTSMSGGGDMVIDPNTGTLFAYSAPGIGNFFSVDVNSATSGTVGGYNLISTGSIGLQLALSTDSSTLYGHDYATGDWYTVNTSSGLTTPVDLKTTPFAGKGFRDLGGSSVQAVPEPSSLALASIGGGIVFWQVSRHRRRRRALRGKFREARNSDPPGEREPGEAECLA